MNNCLLWCSYVAWFSEISLTVFVEYMFCCTLLYVPSRFAVVFMGGGGGLVTLLSFSSWFLVIVMRLFLAVPWVCLQFVIVEFPDHAHLLFL